MTDVNAYQWHEDAIAGKKPETHVDHPECGYFQGRIKGDKRKHPAIIWPDESGDLRCRINDREFDPLEQWPFLLRHPISYDEYIKMGGIAVDTSYPSTEPPSDDKPKVKTSTAIGDFDHFLDEGGLYEGLVEFASKAQHWCNNNAGISDRETAEMAGNCLIKCRSFYAKLQEFYKAFKEVNDPIDAQFQDASSQLQKVAAAARSIVAPWVTENEGSEIAGLHSGNVELVQRRFAKIEDVDQAIEHYRKSGEFMRMLRELAQRDAVKGTKVPGVKILKEAVANDK